jgi:hypothetical protein
VETRHRQDSAARMNIARLLKPLPAGGNGFWANGPARPPPAGHAGRNNQGDSSICHQTAGMDAGADSSGLARKAMRPYGQRTGKRQYQRVKKCAS